MLGWAAKLLQNRNPQSVSDVSKDYNVGEIRYSAHLLDELNTQHQQLMKYYQEVILMIKDRKIAFIQPCLQQLYTEFKLHTMQENVRLFCYLERKHHDDANVLNLLKQERKEAHQISIQMSHFMRKWNTTEITEQNLAALSEHFEKIADLLKQRMHDEEQSLYPIYMQ